MGRFMVVFALVCCLSGCNQIFGIPEVSQSSRIGGQVRGLWDGSEGVTLRLQADGVDTSLALSTNEAFHFEPLLPPGTSYTITVTTSPFRHICLVEDGWSGTVESDAPSVSVVCTGPAVNVALSGPWGWKFDPTKETQTFSASVATQDVALTISSSAVASATVDDAPVRLGEPTPRISLPLGTTTMAVFFDAGGGLSKTYRLSFARGAQVLEQLAYGKASNSGLGDGFGGSVSVSIDTLAVGAPGEDGGSGAVYVFFRSGVFWFQQAYLKASNVNFDDNFGIAVSLSGDTLAVGAIEDSAATGVNGDQADNSAPYAGAVYVFARSGGFWSQQAYLKASNTSANDVFGGAVSLSGDTLAVGARGEDSAATGVNGNQADNSALSSGAVYVFSRSGSSWSQQAYLKASNTDAGDSFGEVVSLSGDTLAVGAYEEDSTATGVNGNQLDNSGVVCGAVYVFVRSGGLWSQQAYLKASNTGAFDFFGRSLSLSGDTLAIAASGESSNATGVNGDQSDNSARASGAVYVFLRGGGLWSQQAYLKASNSGEVDVFGESVSLSGDTLAVGATEEDSAATGVNGNQADNSAGASGAVYVFARNAGSWSQQAYLKASNTDPNDAFGTAVSLSRETLAVGANRESSAAMGVNGNQADNSATSAGAVYIFR